jgi:hypothetical protein
MRAFVHVGLAVVFVLAPTLCCCKVRGLGAAVHAAPTPEPASCPLPEPVSAGVKAKASCCHIPKDTPKPASSPVKQPDSKPAKPAVPESCACCGERLDAAQIESQPTVAAAEPTGELLPLFMAALAGSSEHSDRFYERNPPDRAGVDARFAALFERHVLRC